MCCGQKRATLMQEDLNRTPPRSNSIATPSPAAATSVPNPVQNVRPAQPPGGGSSVGLRYLEKSPIRVRGPATGRQYEFSAANPIRLIDARDAESLLRTRFFAKTG